MDGNWGPSMEKLFFYARMSMKLPSYMKWLMFGFLFLQQMIITLDFGDVSTYYTNNSSALRYVCYIFTASMWVLETTNFFYQSFYLFAANICMILFIGRINKKIVNKEHIPSSYFLLVKVWFQYGNTIFQNAIFFRFAFVLNQIIQGNSSGHTIGALILFTLVIINGFAAIKISSTFLEPCGLSFKSALDIFDAHSDYILFIARLVIITLSAFSKENYVLYAVFVAIFEALLVIVLFYLRVGSCVYHSSVASFIEVAPFVVHVPVYVCRFVFNLRVFYNILVYFFVLAIYASFHFRYTSKQRHHSVNFFLALVSPGEEVSTTRLTRGLATTLRIAAFEVGTPELFDKFIRIIGVSDLRADHILELVRFFSAFTNKCVEALELINEAEKKNPSEYITIQLHYMKKTIKSLLYGAKEKNKQMLDNIHRNYLVDMHKYWVHKAKGKHFKVMLDALRVTYDYFELINMMQYLIERYPLDGDLRIHYADILFIAFGQAKKSIINRRLGLKLKNNTAMIENQIYMQYTKFNPHIMQHEGSTDVTETSETGSCSTSSSNVIRFHFDDETIQIDDSSSLAAVYVQKGKSFIPVGTFLNAFVSIIIVIALHVITYNNYSNIEGKYAAIKEEMDKLSVSYFAPLSGILMPYLIKKQMNFEPHNATEEQCKEKYGEVYARILKNVQKYYISVGMQTKLAARIFQYMNRFSIVHKMYCEKISSFIEIPGKYFTESISESFSRISFISTKLSEMTSLLKELHRLPRCLMYIVASWMILMFITYLVFFIQVNAQVFKEEDFIIDFLGSTKRLTLLLLERSVDSWNLLQKLYPMHPVEKEQHKTIQKRATKGRAANRNSLSGINAVEPSPLVNQQQSRHINIAEAGISISFIGKEEMGLMKRAYSPRYTKTDDSNDTCDISETTTRSATEDSNTMLPQNTNFVERAIEDTKISEGKITNYAWFLFNCIPWILIFFLTLFLIPAVYSRMLVENKRVDFHKTIFSQLNDLTTGIKYISDYISDNYNQSALNSLKEIGKRLSNNDTYISLSITKTHCTTVNGQLRCYSLFDIFNNINGVIREVETYGSLYISSQLINGTVTCWEAAVEESEPLLSTIPASNVTCFFIFLAVLGISVLIIFYHLEKIGQSAINSLFHFPHQYFAQREAERRIAELKRKETNVIYVSVFTKTGEIYTISSNVEQILNRDSYDFIGKEFCSEFEANNLENESTLLYRKDRKQRVFICEKLSTGVLTRCALFEKSSSLAMKKRETEMINSMLEYVPFKFAKQFCENGEDTFYFTESTAMAVRINTELPLATMDTFFSKINQVISVYPTAVIAYAATNVVFIIIEKSDSMSDLLLTKDIIQECSKFILGLALFKTDVKVTLNLENEPFILPRFDKQVELIKILFTLPSSSIGVVGSYYNNVDNVGTQQMHKNLNYRVITFDDYLEIVIKNL